MISVVRLIKTKRKVKSGSYRVFHEPDGQRLENLGRAFSERKMRPTVEQTCSLANIFYAHLLSQRRPV
ncbi:MAG TPA: hypothetical protein DD856_16740 [Sulfobacillus sp.]|nr:hypothetical protein [Sulfobacillus sp.]